MRLKKINYKLSTNDLNFRNLIGDEKQTIQLTAKHSLRSGKWPS